MGGQSYRVETVVAGIHRVKTGYWPGVNSYLLEEEGGLTLVDTGFFWCGAVLNQALLSLGRPLRRILLTHFHPDHSGSAAELSERWDCPVLVHPADRPYVAAERWLDEHPGWGVTRFMLHLARLVGMLATRPPARVECFEEGDRIGPWRVLFTPGHTPGSCSFWDAERSILIAGDNLVHMPWGVRVGVPWWTLDHPLQKASLARYRGLGARLLLPGHGPPWFGELDPLLEKL